MLDGMKLKKEEIVLLALIFVYVLASFIGESELEFSYIFRYCMTSHKIFLFTVPIGMVCMYKMLKDDKSNFTFLINGMWVGTGILEIKGVIDCFVKAYEYEGMNEYFYNTLHQLMENSQIWGRGMSAAEVKYVLPAHTTTMMFANIMAQYGIAVGIAVAMIIVLVLLALIIRSQHNSVKNRLMTTTSCLILIGILMINILENLRVLPPVTGVTFLPFVSTNPGDMIVSIGLLGISVYFGLKKLNPE